MQSEKMAGIGTLASGIAHEFNNLIGGMMGYAQLAATTDEQDDYKKAVEVVFSSSQRAKKIIANLLTFSRRIHHEIETIDVTTMSGQVLTLVERSLQKQNIEISNEVDPTLTIQTDVGQVQQVLMNLVINAKHAMPVGGHLAIGAFEKDECIHITVTDTGVGISPDHIDKIFEPFFTTRSSMGVGAEEGTGLGLSLSYALIKDLGGEILVETEFEKGSTFTVVLPGQKGSRKSEVQAERKRPAPLPDDGIQSSLPDQKRSVLVVDDDRTTLDLMYQVLTRDGHEVITSSTGFLAVEMARNHTFDLMFVDAVMPGMDGIETLTELVRIQPKASAVMITGALGDELEALLRDLRILSAEVLQKPFEISSIQSFLSKLPRLSEEEA
jgi:CheY-like chemotaxis protein